MAAGGNLSFASQIGGDLRAAGGTIAIIGSIDGELMVAGGQVDIIPSSTVEGDFLIAGGMINIGGTMNGNGRIMGEEVRISGTVDKDVYVKANRLVIEETAVINGNIEYKGVEEATVKEGAEMNGKIAFTKIETKKDKPVNWQWKSVLGAIGFVKFLIMLAAALVLFFLAKSTVVSAAGKTLDGFWKELLRGLVLLIVVPVMAIILFATIIGSLVGIFIVALYALLIILGSVFSGIILAELLNRIFFGGPKGKKLDWPMVILGMAVLALLAFIPFVGWIICLAFFLAGLGAVSNLLYRQMKTLRK
jgi:cytoskeletal protein CcmA (bactofilin family)